MASRVIQRPLFIQEENLEVNHTKKAGFDGTVKNSKTATKKGGVALGSRKALNDITNKTPHHREASLLKKNLPKEEVNVAEERVFHDHKKCIKENQTASNTFDLDMVLPGYDSVSTARCPDVKQVKTDPDSPCCYPELEELSMLEFSDWFESSTRWQSPPCSPLHWDSPFSLTDENLEVNQSEKACFNGIVKNSKAATRKGGVALGSCKALNDITNKTSFCQEVSSLKKNLRKEEINVAEEMFLHDHKKCIQEKQAALNTFCLDMVLPGYDSMSTAEDPKVKQVQTDPDSPHSYPEVEELSMSESLTRWHSPPCSPLCGDSPPFSPLSWQFEAVDFVLKQECDI